MSTYVPVWELDSIFQGGSHSSQLHHCMKEFKDQVTSLKEKLECWDGNKSPSQWHELLVIIQHLGSQHAEMNSFVDCLVSQDVKDEKAQLLQGSLTQLGAEYRVLITLLEQKLGQLSEENWFHLKESELIHPIAFSLEEMRSQSLEKLSIEQETLVGDLSIGGYHGWEEMYNTVVGKMKVTIEEDGEIKWLSMGQLSNKMLSPERTTRTQMFQKWEEAWKSEAELFATMLNHISGYRLQLYKHRKWKNVLKEPLMQNRMEEETLEAMWSVISKEKHRLLPYMERKAKLLGTKKLHFVDIHAPLPGEEKVVSYDDGAQFIVEQFQKFHPNMAQFAQMALDKRWVEANDRKNKRPGGFMTYFPLSQESRIFMNYSGTTQCIYTLAHELGHAYHAHVMKDLPFFSHQYGMNVAEITSETASIFAEMIVRDAVIQGASSKEEKIPLIADKIERGISFLMAIPARFLFEKRLYEMRERGLLGVEQLCQLMVDAQKECFAYSLSEYSSYLWASKPHIYFTDTPFYNFPYSFGFLFSAEIYAQAKREGRRFMNKYDQLLCDTAGMDVEDLANQHLGVNLQEEAFWKSAVDVVLEDVDEFISLTS